MRKVKKPSDCWEWLSPERVVELALSAYKIAAFDAVPPTGQQVWQGGRVQFAEDLEQRFGALLQLALRDSREAHRVNDVPYIERALSGLPADWLPGLGRCTGGLESMVVGEGAACGRGEAAPGAGAERKEGVQPPVNVPAARPQALLRSGQQAWFPSAGGG